MHDLEQPAFRASGGEETLKKTETSLNRTERARRSHRFGWAFASIITAPLAFLIFELLVRASPYTPLTDPMAMAFVNPEWKDSQTFVLDADLFWRFRPNTTVSGHSKDHGAYTIAINNLGFRGKHFPDPDAAGAFRVMFLGDSCIFGWYAPDGYTLPDRLQALLQEHYPHQRFNTFIGAAPGYSSFQALRILRLYGEQYRPHVVVVYLGSNDALPCLGYPDSEMMKRMTLDLRVRSILGKSRFFLLCRDLFRSEVMKRERTKEPNRKPIDRAKGPFRVPITEFAQNLAKIVTISRECFHTDVVFLTRQDLRPKAPVFPYNDVMRTVSLREHVPLVDVAKLFAEQDDPRTLYAKPHKDPVHPNSLGCDGIARLTLQTMESSGVGDLNGMSD